MLALLTRTSQLIEATAHHATSCDAYHTVAVLKDWMSATTWLVQCVCEHGAGASAGHQQDNSSRCAAVRTNPQAKCINLVNSCVRPVMLVMLPMV